MSDRRDRFAAAALQGILAHPDTVANAKAVALGAWEVADAMLAASPAAAPATERTHDGDCEVYAARVCTCGYFHRMLPKSRELPEGEVARYAEHNFRLGFLQERHEDMFKPLPEEEIAKRTAQLEAVFGKPPASAPAQETAPDDTVNGFNSKTNRAPARLAAPSSEGGGESSAASPAPLSAPSPVPPAAEPVRWGVRTARGTWMSIAWPTRRQAEESVARMPEVCGEIVPLYANPPDARLRTALGRARDKLQAWLDEGDCDCEDIVDHCGRPALERVVDECDAALAEGRKENT